MHSKIKEIRMRLGLSEAQVSSLLNISCYKYRRFENGSLTLTVDVLILLSIIYDIPVDLLVFDRFSVDTIFKETSIKKLLNYSIKEKLSFFENNMCKYCTFGCNTINYRVVKNILVQFLNKFSKSLQNLRCLNLLEISEIAALLKVDVEYYLKLESGKIWPSVNDLVEISSILSTSINQILAIRNEADN